MSDLAELLTEARTLLAELEAAAGTTKPRAVRAFDRLTAQADIAFPRGGSGGRGPGGHSDPTLNAVFDDDRKKERDRILSTRDELVDQVKMATFKLRHAVTITEVTNRTVGPEKHNPGCKNCERVVRDGRPHPEAYQRVRARELCEFCYRFEVGDGPTRPGYGEPPVQAILRWHLDHLGTEVPRTMVRDLMPEAWKTREARKKRPEFCGHPTFLDGIEDRCAREFMHSGQCLPASRLDEIEGAA